MIQRASTTYTYMHVPHLLQLLVLLSCLYLSSPVSLLSSPLVQVAAEVSSSADASDGEGWSTWTSRETYYYDSLRDKLGLLLASHLSKGCLAGEQAVQYVEDNNLMTGSSADSGSARSGVLHASSWPIRSHPSGAGGAITKFWKSMMRPALHRVDPYLCAAVYSKKYPLFNNTKGCQLKHYMHPGAPRCQAPYLKHICSAASRGIFDSSVSASASASDTAAAGGAGGAGGGGRGGGGGGGGGQGRGFVLPEADHSTAPPPPEPYLLHARDALVSMCGDISMPCGVVHASANCMTTGNMWQANQFHEKCSHVRVQDNSTSTHSSLPASIASSTAPSAQCTDGAPWTSDVHFYEKVFVVAEVDDTYLYHVHLEIVPRLVYHLDFLLQVRSVCV